HERPGALRARRRRNFARLSEPGGVQGTTVARRAAASHVNRWGDSGARQLREQRQRECVVVSLDVAAGHDDRRTLCAGGSCYELVQAEPAHLRKPRADDRIRERPSAARYRRRAYSHSERSRTDIIVLLPRVAAGLSAALSPRAKRTFASPTI